MILTVKKTRGGFVLVIPKDLAAEMRLEAGASVEATPFPTGVVLQRRRLRERRPIKELVKGMKRANYKRQSAALGDSGVVGKEYW